ncbi:MAG: hypothetical protein K8T10_11710 [Candidatus Eremiobacteraeota bacterium]|nr:hypothetical protein [Candidatus Eremiobacteraeota bacterium]
MTKKVKYAFVLSREKIEEFCHYTPERILDWLEEANEFVNAFVDPRKRKIWEEMNKGKDEHPPQRAQG